MCRWLAYRGEPRFLEDMVATPQYSLIAQSLACREGSKNTNGDGFGIAWYDRRAEPGLYREVFPAWSDDNLRSLCRHLHSGLFLAHVRASTGTAVIRPNCHPFSVGKMSFVHNGAVEGYDLIRRSMEARLPDHLYHHRVGTTDSEVLFLLMLAEGLETDPLPAAARAVAIVEDIQIAAGMAPAVRFSVAFSDGISIYAVRYSSDDVIPTLYYERRPEGITVVSEPLDDQSEQWIRIDPGQAVCVTPHGLSFHKFEPLRN